MKNKLSEHCVDFIDDAKIEGLVNNTAEDKSKIREVIAKSIEKKALDIGETASLLSAKSPEIVDDIFNAARQLKRDVYGNRIVVFAPLYIGNRCINDCAYCAFRRSLRTTVRKTLTQDELIAQIEALEDSGHKRLILVFGEHPDYSPDFISDTVRKVYDIRKGHGEIRRLNINAAPMDHEGYKKVKDAGIGTYQIFQETYGVGPHTISFPRIRPAHGVDLDKKYFVSDYDFKRLVAILRLSVPYTGMILTARETAEVRREVMAFGVSQIDAGTKLELAGYTEKNPEQELRREQFQVGDIRPMDEILRELLHNGYIPSFCTSCYRSGRTGQIFMEYAIPGFIEKFCTPNAILTLEEYLIDYASPETRRVGEKLIVKELQKIRGGPQKQKLLERLENIKSSGQRDLYF
ncbi:MAG TPA: [FeFe] hydrogenase H-cluster radical SAM maturase HydG [Lentisphaeria bacterium]|nr:MAG: [FeFe] hydrogenase H-cluster radical SAM maturase HydG [Lentisphaerae bacterium GWF2_50_93]HCE43988.1 [FeFe] hydrogenase H-cluster radical SAM maturase HydG [Lentisphaeria bacterium]